MKYKGLWMVVVLLAAADIGTTMYGMSVGYTESNPIVSHMLDTGNNFIIFVSIKLAVIMFGLLCQWLLPCNEWVVPVSISIPWLGAVVLNIIALVA